MKHTLISQGGAGNQTLEKALSASCGTGQFDRLDVAVAYATLPGVEALKLALGGIPERSRWVVGLDDAITQPEALEYIAGLAGSELRVVELMPARRFHPKMYLLWSSSAEAKATAAIGSGNLTVNGFSENGETAVVLAAEAEEDANELKQQWQDMWDLGHSSTEEELAEYRELFESQNMSDNIEYSTKVPTNWNQITERSIMSFETIPTSGRSPRNRYIPPNGNANVREFEKSDHWVNTVLIGNGEITQIGFGKPLRFFTLSDKTATSSEEFNRVNALSNSVITQLHSIGKNLKPGESYIMAPGYNKLPDSHEALTLEETKGLSDKQIKAIKTKKDFVGFGLEIRRVADESDETKETRKSHEEEAMERLNAFEF